MISFAFGTIFRWKLQRAKSLLSWALIFALSAIPLVSAHADWTGSMNTCNSSYSFTGPSVANIAGQAASTFNSCNTCSHHATVVDVNENAGLYRLHLTEGHSTNCAPERTVTHSATCTGDCVLPEKNNPPQCPVGNPCDPATGTKYEIETDYAGLGLNLRRSYSSQPAIYESAMKDRGLGVGWRGGPETSFLTVTTTHITFGRADGYAETFTDVAGSWVGSSDSDYSLVPTGNGFELIHSSGRSMQFDSNGRLQSTTEVNGWSSQHQYNLDDRVEQITGPFGHALTFTYNASGHLATMMNGAGEVTSYSYDFGDSPGSTYEERVLTDNPVGYWRLDEDAGQWAGAADPSLKPKGEYKGAFTLGQDGPSPRGGSVSLDATADGEVDLNFSDSYTSELTLEIWVKPNAIQADAAPHIFTKNGFYASSWSDFPIRLTYSSTSGFWLGLSKGDNYSLNTNISSGAVTPGVWHHVVAVYKANDRAELWVNGVLKASTSIDYEISANTRNWKVGNVAREYAGGTDRGAFAGELAEAALYSSALSSTTIQEHYDAIDFVGNLERVDYPNGTAKLYHYEDVDFPNHLTGISHVDVGGIATRYGTYAYDADGYAVLTEHAGGTEKFTLAYPSNTETQVTDANGNTVTYNYEFNEGVKKLTSKVNGADLKNVEQTYDSQNNMLCRKDEEGNVTEYQYNSFNQRTSMTSGLTGNCTTSTSTAETRTTNFEYVSTDLDLIYRETRPSVHLGSNSTTTYTYGDANNPNRPTIIAEDGYRPDGTAISQLTTYVYDSSGRVVTIDGPRTDVTDTTTVEYYVCTAGGECGQIKKLTNALGHQTTFDTYDAVGRLTQMTDPNGLVTTISYDGRGNISSTTQTPPSGPARVYAYTYNAANQVLVTTIPTSATLTNEYNAAQQLIKTTDPFGNYVEYSYDSRGNRTGESVYDSSAVLTRFITNSYDARNNISQINNAGSVTQFTNNALGNVSIVVDPKQQQASTKSYDSLKRLIQDTNALSGNTLYAYDDEDRVTTVVAPNGATTSFQWDDLGNLLLETSADAGTTSFVYDDAGNAISETDGRGITAQHTYDPLNRTTATDYPGTADDLTYQYDSSTNCTFGVGRLCVGSVDFISTEYSFDVFGNVTTKRQTDNGVTNTTTYTYSALDQVLSMNYPDSRTVTYMRDTLGRITDVDVLVNGLTVNVVSARAYSAIGLMTSQLLGNSVSDSRTYDLKGRTLTQTSTVIGTRAYVYDDNNNLNSLDSTDFDATYTYNALDQLITDQITTSPTSLEQFTYDANGNRLTDGGSTYTYQANSNRLDQENLVTYTYDGAGNTLFDGQYDYVYNNRSRLIESWQSGIKLAGYTHDYIGQRTSKTIGTNTTDYHYNEKGQLIAESDVLGNLVVSYVWDDVSPIAVIKHGVTDSLFYVHSDTLGSPRYILDVSQTVVWRWSGEAFGGTLADEDPDSDSILFGFNLRFPGQYFDSETGNHYNYFRDYDPTTGRYSTSDPIGLEGGLNRFAYVGGNPNSWVDPTGEAGVAVGVPIAILGGGAAICALAPNSPSCEAARDLLQRCIDGLDELDLFEDLIRPISPLGPLLAEGDDTPKKEAKPGTSGKEGAKDIPSWAQGERPNVGESGKKFADRLLGDKYGKGNFPKGPGSEHNRIRKWGDRSFQDPGQ